VHEAIELFSHHGMEDKVQLLRFRGDEMTSVYTFGSIVNHFYGQLVPSSKFLTDFDIRICEPGFVLLFPPHGKPGEMPVYHHEEQVFGVFQEYENWMRILGVRTVAHLN